MRPICTWMCKKGRQYDRYNIIAITLRYIFALSHKASKFWEKVMFFYSYCLLLIEIVIAS
jgi:hypothetical protein